MNCWSRGSCSTKTTACQGILATLQISPPAWRRHKSLGGHVSCPAMHVTVSTVGNIMWAAGGGTAQHPCSCPEQSGPGSRVFVQSREKRAKGGFTFLANPLHCIFPCLPIFSWVERPCLAMVSPATVSRLPWCLWQCQCLQAVLIHVSKLQWLIAQRSNAGFTHCTGPYSQRGCYANGQLLQTQRRWLK